MSASQTAAVLAIALAAGTATLAPVLPPAAAQGRSRNVDGRNVSFVRVEAGATFVQSGPSRWNQYEPNGRLWSQLEEVRRDASTVHLRDRGQGVEVLLDLRAREVRGTDPGTSRWRRFYAILDLDAGDGRGRRGGDSLDRGGRGSRVTSGEIDVGPIWNQEDAEFKCRKKARKVHGTWTGHWRTIVPNRRSVCSIESGEYDDSGKHDAIRDVQVGALANQAAADRICPAEAARQRAKWTGQWVSVGLISTCQLRFR